jgi:AraC-like DNA-binding protein
VGSVAIEAGYVEGEISRLGPLALVALNQAHATPPILAGHIGIALAQSAVDFRQAGRKTHIELGEWTLFCGDRPASATGEVDIAYVPKDAFHEHGLCVRILFLRRFSDAAPINRIVFSFFNSIISEAASVPAKDLSDLALAGMHLLKKALLHASPPRAAKAVFKERVRNWIDWRIRDPNLSPLRIARALNCTPRNIHRAFEGQGETLSQYILRRRLEGCATDLRAAEQEERSVTEIAFSWGFNNAAHFSRVFRRRFGCTASAYRCAARQGVIDTADRSARAAS